jgi:5-formyltetrahydrofolate cyclo-ligase
MTLVEADHKKHLRQQLIQARQAIPIEIWQQKSQMICEQIARSHLFQTAQVILSYTSFRQEPDLSALCLDFPDKVWGFSRCVGQQLIWHQVNPGQLEPCLEVGKFGIRQPLSFLPLIELEQVDLILIPTVACDRYGYRLGYGGGFYDRFLCNQQGYKLGIIFTDFCLDSLPIESWDIPMAAICTESGVQTF